MSSEVISQRPYLLRAMHEWMTDNGHTPYVVIDVGVDGVDVPDEYVEDGRIVLNVSYAAAHNLDMGKEMLCFDARFAGQPRRVFAPMAAVLGIYARETGQGMIFSESTESGQVHEADAPPTADHADEAADEQPGDRDARRSHLRIIK